MENAASFDLGLGLQGSHVVVTGAAGAIGSVLVQAFLAAGCLVTAIDINSEKLVGLPRHERFRIDTVDITDENQLENAFAVAVSHFGMVSVCIAAAGLDLSYIMHVDSLADMAVEQWAHTMRVNGQGTFLTARTWLRGVRQHAGNQSQNLSLVLFGSEAGSMGVRTNADYAASKSLMVGLMRSLAPDVVNIHPNARVNVIAPGPVNTPQFKKECDEDAQAKWVECEATVAQKAPTSSRSVATTCLFLASEAFSQSIHGQVISVNGGKSGKLFWMPDGTPC